MQKLQLGIPEPCHQNWNDMQPNEQGRFCSSCAKTVVDFSTMSDAQLILYFENLKNENVCGRVYPDQLNRSIQTLPKPKKKIFLYWQYVIAFFMMLGKGQSAKAQGAMRVKTVLQSDTSGKKPTINEDRHIMVGKLISNPVGHREKIWKSLNTDGQPVPFASLEFFPSGNGIAADENGVIKPGKNNTDESVTITAIGYQSKTIAVKDIREAIVLEAEHITLGEVVIPPSVTITCSRNTIAGGMSFRMVEKNIVADTIQNILSVFDPALTVFPNPVTKGGTLNISAKLKQTGSYKIDINDAAGRLLLQQNYIANNKTAETKIKIPQNWSNGTYFIMIYDDKGQKQGKGKFIIQ